MTSAVRRLCFSAAVALAALGAGHALAQVGGCAGAGVITRIDGDAADVSILRADATVPRPRVLEVVCVGDKVSANGATQITLSLDGKGVVHVDSSAAYVVPAKNPPPTLADNAYKAVSQDVTPDMKRLAWDVRLKGGATDFAFALPELAAGGEKLSAGDHALLLRVNGGVGPYAATLTGPNGAVLAKSNTTSFTLVFPTVSFAPGHYHLSAVDGAGVSIQADFTVADRPAPLPPGYDRIDDPEVRAAAVACALAKAQTATWALEAEQLLAAAPANGLDRSRVYDLIESYGA
jgi:hypothetical protein